MTFQWAFLPSVEAFLFASVLTILESFYLSNYDIMIDRGKNLNIFRHIY
jgi:hypothetical protein